MNFQLFFILLNQINHSSQSGLQVNVTRERCWPILDLHYSKLVSGNTIGGYKFYTIIAAALLL